MVTTATALAAKDKGWVPAPFRKGGNHYIQVSFITEQWHRPYKSSTGERDGTGSRQVNLLVERGSPCLPSA